MPGDVAAEVLYREPRIACDEASSQTPSRRTPPVEITTTTHQIGRSRQDLA